MKEKLITIKAGEHEYINSPFSLRLKVEECSEPISLLDLSTGKDIPCQWENMEGETVLSWIIDKLPKGAERGYKVTFGGKERPSRAGVSLKKTNDRIEVLVGDELFTSYHYGTSLARPFFHPVIGPGGRRVTRNFPMESLPDETKDHSHHRSLWVAYGDINNTDNWSEEKGHARIVHQGFEELIDGPVFGKIKVKNSWVGSSSERLLEEDRTALIYNIREKRIIDLTISFKATKGDVTFGDTKEGGIVSVRVATSMDGNTGGRIVNSYGAVGEKECWGKRANWCDYSGSVEGEVAGIAIFDNPDNFRYPTYWHVRDYGLMTANPFGISHFKGSKSYDGSHTIRAGDVLTFRYRLLIHQGDAIKGRVGENYHGYINSPKAL